MKSCFKISLRSLQVLIEAIVLMYLCFAMYSCRKHEKQYLNIIEEWNNAINEKDYNALYSLYADKVFYYGKALPKEECINDKRRFFSKNPNFAQMLSQDSVKY